MTSFCFYNSQMGGEKMRNTSAVWSHEVRLSVKASCSLNFSCLSQRTVRASEMSLLEDFVSLLFSSPTTLLGAAALLLLLCFFVSNSLKLDASRREPPGPKPLPVLGNLLQLDLKRPYKTLSELSKEYGSVFTVYFGPDKVVVLAGYKTVKEALVGHAEEFGDRQIPPIFQDVNHGHGILFANGESWKEMRSFALTTLKDFEMDRGLMEKKILEECRHMIQWIDQHKGKPFDSSNAMLDAIANLLYSIMYGSRFEYDDPEFRFMREKANQSVQLFNSTSVGLYNMFPRLLGWVPNRQQIQKNHKVQVKIAKERIKKLKDTLNPQIYRGFVDCFLTRIQKEEEASVGNTYFNENNLRVSVSNMLGAGTAPTAITLRWAFLFMAKYPRIQEKVHEELDRVLGSREVCIDDRKSMPFINAVVHETLRLTSIVPLSVPRKTSRDVTFQGYFIKGGTTVFPMLISVQHDESEWESPFTFNPSRFLDEEGSFVKRDAFMPFSVGLRPCVGQDMAQVIIFLYFTSILQRFTFTPPPGVTEDELDLSPAVGLPLKPTPHELCAVSRDL